MRQDSHPGDVVHAVRRYVALLVAIEPVEGESTPRRVVFFPSRRPAPVWRPDLQPVAQRRWGELALVPVGHRGEEGEGTPEEPHQVYLWRLLRRRINTDVQVRYPVRWRTNHVDGESRWPCVVLCCVVLCCVVLCCVVLCCVVLCCVVLCCVVLFCVVLCCVVLCCVVLCCGVLCRRHYYQWAKAGMSTHGYR